MCSLYKVRIFSVSENGENGLGDEGADGGNAAQNFGARTAPGYSASPTTSSKLEYRAISRILGQIFNDEEKENQTQGMPKELMGLCEGGYVGFGLCSEEAEDEDKWRRRINAGGNRLSHVYMEMAAKMVGVDYTNKCYSD